MLMLWGGIGLDSGNLLQQLIESKLEYLKYSITPEESGLDLIDKDAASGNLDKQSLKVLRNYYDSLHRLRTFVRYEPLFIDTKTGTPIKVITLSPEIKRSIDEGDIMVKQIEKYLYPTAIENLRSKIKTLLVSSGSYQGFKSLLQHTSITKGEQVQTLKEETDRRKKIIGRRTKWHQNNTLFIYIVD